MNLQELIAVVFDHARGMWRYRWWSIALAWLVFIGGAGYVYSLPDVFRASAKVFVDTNSLIKPLMRGLTVTENTINEVDIFAKALLTRPNMEKVAHETDLDLRAHTERQMEALVTTLQRKIHISGGSDNIFTIQYEDPSRAKARAVVGAVLDTFVEGALGSEGNDADVTERVLDNELKVHEQRLRETEQALAKFKQKNLGFMPGQYGDYFSQLQAAQGAVTDTQEKLKVATQRRDELKRQLEGEDPVIGIMPGPLDSGSRCTQSSQLSDLKTQLASLRVQYTDKHPRVIALQAMIADLQKRCDAEVKAAAKAAGATAPIAPNQSLEANPVYQNMKIQLSDAEVQIAELTTQLKAAQSQVDKLKRDVDKITEVDAQLKQLTRDYDVVQQRHKELLERWEDLQAKKRLDPVTDKVKFRRIEPPFAAADPVGPNRPLLLAGVLVAALGAGLGVAFALNQLQPVFFRRGALTRVVGVPVLGSIGMILTPEDAVKRRRDIVAWSTASVMLLLVTAAAVVFSGVGGTLLRDLLGKVLT